MGVKAIKKARQREDRDTFPEKTVIRWVSSRRYDYCAIKTSAGWFTTARYGNCFVPQTLDWEELLSILARSETTAVQIADSWQGIDDTD